MRKEEWKTASSCGLAQLHAVCWLPEGEPVGVLQLVHGMQEYIDRYEPMAAFFCAHGYVVCGHDHLGHGGSLIGGKRGYFGREHPVENLVGDVDVIRREMQTRFAGLPYFVYGFSMGSFVTRLYLTRRAEGLSGAILCGTAGPNPVNLAAKPALRLLWALRGASYVSKRFALIIPVMYNKRFASEGHSAWLTRDKAVRDVYNHDPQVRFFFTVSALWTLLDMLDRVSAKDWPRRLPQSLPVLLTSGADDPVGAFGEGVRTVYDRMMQRGFDDLEIKLYYDCRHELMNEENRDEILADWLAWLEARRPKEGTA